MNFLLDNPLASMDGIAFLVLYVVIVICSLLILAIARSNLDRSDKLPVPAIPPEIDPYEVAFLRGGTNELARSVVFSLMQKGFVEVVNTEDAGIVRRAVESPEMSTLKPIERLAFEWIGAQREAKEVFDTKSGFTVLVEQFAARYEIELSNRQFLTPADLKARAFRLGLLTTLLLLGFGGYKAITAILVGRFNIIFTIVIMVITGIIAMSMGRLPRVSKLGKVYLGRLQSAFEDLKYRSQAPYISSGNSRPVLAAEGGYAGVDPLLLSVGVFGTGILAGTVFASYNDAFARAHREAASSGGACGSSCGSCSSGDGGSGCGGGCGGCS